MNFDFASWVAPLVKLWTSVQTEIWPSATTDKIAFWNAVAAGAAALAAWFSVRAANHTKRIAADTLAFNRLVEQRSLHRETSSLVAITMVQATAIHGVAAQAQVQAKTMYAAANTFQSSAHQTTEKEIEDSVAGVELHGARLREIDAELEKTASTEQIQKLRREVDRISAEVGLAVSNLENLAKTMKDAAHALRRPLDR